jgi:hypothetical protein
MPCDKLIFSLRSVTKYLKSLGSSVSIFTRLRAGRKGFLFLVELLMKLLLFVTATRSALGSTQLLMQWTWEALSLGVKRPGREANHPPPTSAGVKNARSYNSTPQYIFMEWYIVKHSKIFKFTLPLALFYEMSEGSVSEWIMNGTVQRT